jgi:hypothetical protein
MIPGGPPPAITSLGIAHSQEEGFSKGARREDKTRTDRFFIDVLSIQRGPLDDIQEDFLPSPISFSENHTRQKRFDNIP